MTPSMIKWRGENISIPSRWLTSAGGALGVGSLSDNDRTKAYLTWKATILPLPLIWTSVKGLGGCKQVLSKLETFAGSVKC